jgi:tetratricopeptide (TPR) repeat protein
MIHLRRALAIFALLAAWLAAPAAAQQGAVPPGPAKPPAAVAQKDEKPAQTEADTKYSEIMKGLAKDPDKAVVDLEQFVRENPSFPRLENAYASLLVAAGRSKGSPEKTLALADEALEKFSKPGSLARTAAVRAKFQSLRALKREDEVKAFGAKLLETETSPAVLQSAASQADPDTGLKLIEKAIAERSKTPDSGPAPTLDALRWEYGQGLNRAGRKDDALKVMQESLEQSTKAIAELEALPKDDPKRGRVSMLRMLLGGRYLTLVTISSLNGNHEKALEYVALAEKNAENPLENTSRFETLRAGIYEKMGKPDLQLESWVRAFASRMDTASRDKLLAAAAAAGVSSDEAYERARKVRRQTALAISAFELKTPDGKTAALESLRGKVTLLNFFFPT